VSLLTDAVAQTVSEITESRPAARVFNNLAGSRIHILAGGAGTACLERGALSLFDDIPDLQHLIRRLAEYHCPRHVGADGRANSQYLALPTTPGQFIYICGPNRISTDMSVNKDLRITERVRFTLQAKALNFLNHPVFGFGSHAINSTSFGQLSSRVGPRNIQIRAYLRW
jgi:hypothetical protein